MKTLIAAALVLPVIAAFGVATAGGSPPDDLQAAKAATARYHSLHQARDAGYSVEDEPCVPPVGPRSPAMGIHAANEALLADPAIDLLRPELLLYIPDKHGKLRLVGLEYWAVALANTASGPRPWFGADPPPLGFFNPAPVLFGRAFDGPMAGHNPSMPWHYDLHVWVWEDNPFGMFAPVNPNLACP